MGCTQSTESEELLATEARVNTVVAMAKSTDPSHDRFAERTARGLRSLPYLKMVGDNELRKVAELVQIDLYAPHTIIGKEGTPATRVHIIVEGEIVVTAKNQWGLAIELSVLNAGAVLNEVIILEKNHVHSTTSATTKETLVFSFNRVDAMAMKKVAPNVFRIFETMGQELLSARKAVTQISIFKQMSQLKQHLLQEILRPSVHRKTEVILERGEDTPRRFFIVVEGEAQVFVGRKLVRTIGSGEFFGEVSLVTSQPHSATVRVSEEGDVHTLECSREEFRNLLAGEPAVLAEISLRVLGRDVSLEDVLNVKMARQFLTSYAAKEFATENLEFWLAIERFKSIDTRIRKSVAVAVGLDPEDVKARKRDIMLQEADLIYYKYVVESASTQINLGSAVFEELRSRMKHAEYSFDMFDAAQDEIFDLISGDTFVRFKESYEFRKLLDAIGAYDYGPREHSE
ncbi:Regulator of G-protein signaling 14 [Hondaea fermentalgiana]|uniref:Regulator of G-protein signaling 14 n=1 Tax=Hondaea fermentalgiana TaxID=2315210 RepID=A0A2R5GSV9_9STRA|nr:Regulator of G-protein signaling 14 [Hondaea fermentalgiana]|eukprot:GBG30964.1 Regulator of G-protein signaling 14 [Hondaea fermentalgiana]